MNVEGCGHGIMFCTCTISSEKCAVKIDCGINRMLNYALCDFRRSWNAAETARMKCLGNEFPFC